VAAIIAGLAKLAETMRAANWVARSRAWLAGVVMVVWRYDDANADLRDDAEPAGSNRSLPCAVAPAPCAVGFARRARGSGAAGRTATTTAT